jgi:hypothetical protein
MNWLFDNCYFIFLSRRCRVLYNAHIKFSRNIKRILIVFVFFSVLSSYFHCSILTFRFSSSQELIVNELVNAVDALGREALLEAAALFARSIPGSAALSRSPLAAIVLPFVRLPLRGAAQLSDEDRAALATVRGIMSLFAEESTTTTTSTTTGRTGGAARWQTAEWGDDLLALLRDPRAGVRSSVALGQVRESDVVKPCIKP